MPWWERSFGGGLSESGFAGFENCQDRVNEYFALIRLGNPTNLPLSESGFAGFENFIPRQDGSPEATRNLFVM